MNWLLTIEWNGHEQSKNFIGSKEELVGAAQDLFDRFTGDYNFEYDKFIPAVVCYPTDDSVCIEMDEYYEKQMALAKQESIEWRERREKEEFERLQKKFGKK